MNNNSHNTNDNNKSNPPSPTSGSHQYRYAGSAILDGPPHGDRSDQTKQPEDD